MAREYARFDVNGSGPLMEITQGGLVVQVNTDATDLHRHVRASIPALAASYFEVAFWGDESLTDKCVVGVVKASHPLDQYVGEHADGHGFLVDPGGIYSNGAQTDAAEPAGKKVFIGVYVDPVNLTCEWYVNGSRRVGITLPDSGPWYPAVTVGSDIAYKLSAFINCGQRAFAFPPAKLRGVYRDSSPVTPIYMCAKESNGYMSAPTDTPANTTYHPRITNADQFTVARRCSVWFWGSRTDGAAYSVLEAENGDGRYDQWIGIDARDTPVTVTMVPAGAALSAGFVVATMVLDRCDGVGERLVRFTFRDILATLERPLQQQLFPPWADPGVANQPIPILLGAVRNVEPVLWDQVNRIYALHDAPVTNIAAVRDKAAILDPHSSPPQYTPTSDLRGLILETNPVGVLTVDASSEGAQVVIPGADDIMTGEGLFTTWPVGGSPPTGFSHNGGTGNTFTRQGLAQGMPQDYVCALSTTKTYSPQNGEFGSYLRYDTTSLLPGKTYRISFKLVRTSGSPPPVSGGLQFGFMVRTERNTNPIHAVTPHMLPLQAPQFGQAGQAYTFVYTVPPGAPLKLYFIACASENTSPGVAFGLGSATFYGVQVQLLGDIVQTLPLESITLKDYMTEILETRGEIESTQWVPADLEAIDDAAGYPFGVPIREQTTVRAAAKLPMNSFGMAMLSDRLGRVRFRRLTNPAAADPSEIVAYFSKERNIRYGMQPVIDAAPGLSTTIGARPNWRVFGDSDFVTDYVQVPAALRTQMKRRSRFLETSSIDPASLYTFAKNASPLDSLIDDPEIARDEIDRVMEFYAANRYQGGALSGIPVVPIFFTFVASYAEFPPDLLFADVVHVTYNRFGFNSGKQCAVVDTVPNPYAKTIEITIWSPQ